MSSPQISVEGTVKGNQLVDLLGAEVNVYGLVQSPNNIKIESNNYLWVHTVLEAGKNIEAKIINKLIIDPGAKLISYGDGLIQSINDGIAQELALTSGSLEIAGDAIIKVNKLINQRNGTFKIENEVIEAARNGNHADRKWKLRMNCHKEKFIDNTGPESKILIGGDLHFQGDEIHNSLSKFEIGGDRWK